MRSSCQPSIYPLARRPSCASPHCTYTRWHHLPCCAANKKPGRTCVYGMYLCSSRSGTPSASHIVKKHPTIRKGHLCLAPVAVGVVAKERPSLLRLLRAPFRPSRIVLTGGQTIKQDRHRGNRRAPRERGNYEVSLETTGTNNFLLSTRANHTPSCLCTHPRR